MRVFCAIAIVLLFTTCKKEDTITPVTPPVVTQVTLTLSRTTATPGDLIEVKANTRITDPEITIVCNSITTKGYKTGDSAYTFVVPIITSGSTTVAISSLKNSNSPALTISTYIPIQNAQAVATEFITKRNNLIDSIVKVRPGYNLQPSPESIVMFNQIKDEWDIQYSALSAAEKELIAYIMQKNMPNPASYSFTTNPASNYARESGMQADAGDKLVAVAKVFVTATVLCIATIPAVITSAGFFAYAPSPLSGAIFLASWTAYIVSKEVAALKGKEVATLKGIMSAITDADLLRTTAAEFSNNTEKNLIMSVSFRNLAGGDVGIQGDISSAFNKEQEFINEEAGLAKYYNTVTALFTKLKASFPFYKKIIGIAPTGSMVIDINGVDIRVKGVSDPRIGYSATLTGTTKKIKITSNATTDINFILQVAYVRSLDNKEFTQDIPCTFKALPPPALGGVWTMDLILGSGICDETLIEDELGIPPTFLFNLNNTLTFVTDPVGSNLNESNFTNTYSLLNNTLTIKSYYKDNSDDIRFDATLSYNQATKKFVGTYTNKWTNSTVCTNSISIYK